MKVESEVDPHRAAQLASDLRGIITAAEPALEADELQTLSEVAEFVEDAGCIKTGEKRMWSELTGQEYRVTRWVEVGDGKIMALSKQGVED